MAQFFNIEVQITDHPDASWTRTLSRSDIMTLTDAQGVPIYLDPYLRFWCQQYHVAGDRFECDYGPNPDTGESRRHYMGAAL